MEADALPWPAFLALRRDAWLYALRQTEVGRKALEAFWRLSRQECEWKGEMKIGGTGHSRAPRESDA